LRRRKEGLSKDIMKEDEGLGGWVGGECEGREIPATGKGEEEREKV